MPEPSFENMAVLALESRRASEIAKLIAHYGGRALAAPAMRELPLDNAGEAEAFLRELSAGQFHLLILLTGIGLRRLLEAAQGSWTEAEAAESLRRVRKLARGPKSVAELRRLGLTPELQAEEPNTWREILAALDAAYPQGLDKIRVAVQEYGAPAEELVEGLKQRGAQPRLLRLYRYALPEDITPLQTAIQTLLAGEIAVVLLTSSLQAAHLLQVAREMAAEEAAREALGRTVLASIGPDTSHALRDLGLTPDLEASHPRMGFLVREAAEAAPALRHKKSERKNDSGHRI